MAVTTQEVILVYKSDTSDVVKNVNKAKQSIDKTTDSTEVLTNQLDKMTGGAISGFKNAAQGTKSFITGLKLTRAAIIGTGIGALVIGVIALVQAFGKTEEGARRLKKAFQPIAAIIDVLQVKVSALGGAFFKLFSGDFKGAADDFTKALGATNNEYQNQIELYDQLIDREFALQDARIKQTVQTAKTRAEIKELNLVAEDLTKTTEQREAAAFRAGELERELFEERKRLAEEELAIAQARLKSSRTTTEDREKVAQLEAEIFQLAQESLELQTTLNNKLNTIRAEAIRQRQEELDIIIETRDALNENKVLVEKIETEEVDRVLMGQRRQTEIVETESQRRTRLRREESELFRDFVLKDQETMVNASRAGLNLLADLNASFTGETEAEQKKGFERSKKIQAAQALISTFEATIASYKSVVGTPLVGPILAPIVAAATAAVGFKNVQAIKNQQFQGGGGAPDTGGGGLPNVSARGPQVPTLDLGFFGQGAGQNQPIRAYVLAENVSNSQQANQKIKDQTLIG